MRKLLVASSALLMLLMSSSAAMAQPPENFGAHLTGAQEVPARETRAQGQAVFRLISPTVMEFRLIASNIDNVVAAHIHCGGPTQTSGPAQDLFVGGTAGGGSHDGVLATGRFDPSAAKRCGEMSLLEAMRAGLTYVNVHTNDGQAPTNTGPGDFPGGEIRGQIRPNG